jgi:hypothetical protein
MRVFVVAAAALTVMLGCGSRNTPTAPTPPSSPPQGATGCARTSVGLTPLTDMFTTTYQGEP